MLANFGKELESESRHSPVCLSCVNKLIGDGLWRWAVQNRPFSAACFGVAFVPQLWVARTDSLVSVRSFVDRWVVVFSGPLSTELLAH
jgi:hypothetical protein